MKIIHALKIGMLTLLIVGCNDNGFKSRTITIEGHKLGKVRISHQTQKNAYVSD